MFDKPYQLPSLNSNQVDALRQEALARYERCLQEVTLQHFENFLEYHLIHHAAQFDLFLNLADDLQQRLLALRGYHFDVRNRVVQLFLSMYQSDISYLTPPDEWEEYHLLNPETVMEYVRQKGHDLSRQEEAILKDMIQASLNVCAQLHRDIHLTEQLLILLEDWMDAYKVMAVRQIHEDWQNQPPDGLALIH